MPRVLVIDDDALSRESLTTALTRAGYVVTSDCNGARIESLIAASSCDAILTGLYMPVADGLETLMRAKRMAPGIPVIGMAPLVAANDPCARAMRLLGATEIVAKPTDEAEVLSALAAAIAGRSDPS